MPLLTLTSDIGHQDYLVAAVKAQLLQIDPAFTIIDISHTIAPFNYPQTAYICRSAFKNFPDFTYHIILVNLFEKKPEQLNSVVSDIEADQQGNMFVATADKGLLFFPKGERVAYRIPLENHANAPYNVSSVKASNDKNVWLFLKLFLKILNSYPS